MVTALLRRPDGSVCGVFGLDYIAGRYVVVLARAVILATGYSDRLHARSTGTREMSGDGIAMAWRIGADLVNLEMQWWHTNDIADPPTWQRMQVYPNPMLGSEKSARMVNAAGEEFFNQQRDDPLAYGPYTVQLKALAKQVHAGKARYEGDYFAGFDHCDAGEVEAYTTYGKTFRQLGLAFPQDLVEAAVTAHYRQGGIDVDTATMRASVPGLYVAGGLAGHSNGLIGLATYDGKVVADGIAADFPRLAAAALPEAQVEAEQRRLEGLLTSRADGVLPSAIKQTLRGIMWDKCGVEKDAASLRSALDDIAEIRLDLLPRMGVRGTAKTANFEWLDAIDVVNMVDVCELIVQASLERQESRGPFMRRDYPLQDNESWLAANVMQRTENGFRFRRRPYELPFFRPGLRHARQSRGGVVTDAAWRLGQDENHDTLAARNARLSIGDIVVVRVSRSDPENRAGLQVFEVPYRKWMRLLDALNWIAENASQRSRLPLVLRLQDVRHLRGAHERSRGPGVLGSGRAGHDDRAVAQPAGRARPRRRPRAVRARRSRRSSRGSSGRRPIRASPSRCRTRT